MKFKSLFLVFAILFSLANANADVLIKMEYTSKQQGDRVGRGTLSIQGLKLKMDAVDGQQDGEMIFRGDQEVMYALNHGDKEYIVMNKDLITKMTGVVGGMMKQMEMQLKNVPPDQQAMVKQMMQGQMQRFKNMPPKPKVKIVKTDDKRKIGKYNCTKYEVYSGDTKRREFWVAALGDVPNGEEAAKAFNAYGNFLSGLIEAARDMPFIDVSDNPFSYFEEIRGVPILVSDFKNGKVENETKFVSIVPKSLESSQFDPPKSYKRTDPLAEMGG